MSEHIMEELTIRPLNDVSEKLGKRANEHEARTGTLSALTERCNRLEAENAKLRDAMYTKAGKHALQHMDEDELRIWATQQSEYIEELRGICADMLTCINAYKASKSICWECKHHRDVDELRSVCFLGSDARKLGIEIEDA